MLDEAHIRQACKETLLSLKPIKRVRFGANQDASAGISLSNLRLSDCLTSDCLIVWRLIV